MADRKGGLKENPLLYDFKRRHQHHPKHTVYHPSGMCNALYEKIIVGTRIGTKAAIVPLVIYTAPFLARLETSLLEVGGGIIEAVDGSDHVPDYRSFCASGSICFRLSWL